MQFIRSAARGRMLIGLMVQRLTGRSPRIASGPGKGLRFAAGNSTAVFQAGSYELPVQMAIASIVRSGDVFFDIGANFGFFSVLAARLVGANGAVYAFEPVPLNASVIDKNASMNHLYNIEILRIAVSKNNGESELLLARHAGGAVLKSSGTPPDLAGSLMVETASIDSLLKLHRVRPPDVVKIDVEGAELEVLHGMCEVLHDRAPKVILEVDDAIESKCLKKLEACRAFLEVRDYCCAVLPNAYSDGKWFVRHLVAERKTSRMTSGAP